MPNTFPNLIPPANAGIIPNPSSFIWVDYVDLITTLGALLPTTPQPL